MIQYLFGNINYWFWYGTIALIFLTIQDIRHKKVDTRRNYLMMGVSISLISHVPVKLWYLVVLTLIVILIIFLLNKLKMFGAGDMSGFAWLFYGFGIINLWYLVFFILLVLAFTLFYLAFKKYVFRYNAPAPFYPVILLTYVGFNIALKLY